MSKTYGFAWRWEEEEVGAHPFIDDNAKPLLDDISETERSAPYSPRKKVSLHKDTFRSLH
jgi:hypothetical protein